MAELSAEFEAKLDRMYAHLPYDDSMRHWSGPCLDDDTPLLRGFTEDPRFVGAAQQMLGDDVFLAGVDGNRYTSGFVKDPDDERFTELVLGLGSGRRAGGGRRLGLGSGRRASGERPAAVCGGGV